MKKVLRRFLERVSRGRVLKRRLPGRFGRLPIYVSPDSALKFWRSNIEATDKSLLDWAEIYISSGNVVWDVGANVGLFAFSAAYRAGKTGFVVAIEPDVFLVQLLRKTAAANAGICAKTVVLPIAVCDKIAVQEFAIAARGRSGNFLTQYTGSTQAGGVRETVHVMGATLDWLAQHFPPPDVIKIDVERAEHAVLQGAEQLLRDKKPTILCEVGATQSASVSAFLHDLGYTIFDLKNVAAGPVTSAPFSTLALPSAAD